MPWRKGKKGQVYRVKAKKNGKGSRRKTYKTKTAAKRG